MLTPIVPAMSPASPLPPAGVALLLCWRSLIRQPALSALGPRWPPCRRLASNLAAGVINGKLYVVGGSNSTGALATLEAFTPAAGVANQPPVAEADFIPVDVEEDEGLFTIVAAANDPDDNLESVVAVIELPSLDGLDIELKVKDEIKIEFDLEEGKVEIKGPDPEALLTEILENGGFLVEDGQIIKAEASNESKYELKFKDDILKIEAPEVTLVVTATDTEGASDTATASLVYTPGDDDDDDDDDDE